MYGCDWPGCTWVNLGKCSGHDRCETCKREYEVQPTYGRPYCNEECRDNYDGGEE